MIQNIDRSLQTYLKKDIAFSDEEQCGIYGDWTARYQIVQDLSNADICVLPMSWNYYYQKNKINFALAFVNICKKQQKKILTWITGDYGVTPLSKMFLFLDAAEPTQKL